MPTPSPQPNDPLVDLFRIFVARQQAQQAQQPQQLLANQPPPDPNSGLYGVTEDAPPPPPEPYGPVKPSVLEQAKQQSDRQRTLQGPTPLERAAGYVQQNYDMKPPDTYDPAAGDLAQGQGQYPALPPRVAGEVSAPMPDQSSPFAFPQPAPRPFDIADSPAPLPAMPAASSQPAPPPAPAPDPQASPAAVQGDGSPLATPAPAADKLATPTLANTATADDGAQKFMEWIYSGGQVTDPKQIEEQKSEDRRQAIVMGLLQIAANAGQAKTVGETLSGVASGAAGGLGAWQGRQKERRGEQKDEFNTRLGLGNMFFNASQASATREATAEDRAARRAGAAEDRDIRRQYYGQQGENQAAQRKNETDRLAADITARRDTRLQKIEDGKREAYKMSYDTIAKGLIEASKDPYLDPNHKTLSPEEIDQRAHQGASAADGGGSGATAAPTGGGQQTFTNPKDGKPYVIGQDGKMKPYAP